MHCTRMHVQRMYVAVYNEDPGVQAACYLEMDSRMSCRHTGQTPCWESHVSTQDWWKVWRQNGRERARSPAHSSWRNQHVHNFQQLTILTISSRTRQAYLCKKQTKMLQTRGETRFKRPHRRPEAGTRREKNTQNPFGRPRRTA